MRAADELTNQRGRQTPDAKAFMKQEAEWRRVCSALTRDRVRVRAPRLLRHPLSRRNS
jgi:hypothetical protein